jgi:adenosine deaminase
VKLGVFASLEQHNLKRLLMHGLCVTINSDDPAYFGGYVGDNFSESAVALGLTDAELIALARNSFEASFIDEATRSRYLADIDSFIR